MALIQHGSIDCFSVKATEPALATCAGASMLRTFSGVREATRSIQPVPVDFETTADRRGLTLRSLKLTQNFEGILRNIFTPNNDIYFLAWGWDLSGQPIVEYPGAGATAASCIIPLKDGQLREFIGAGIPLFPARPITAGLSIRIMIWESDQGVRDFGKVMSEIANTVKSSKLTNLLSLLSLTTEPTVATISLVKDASVELADLIGKILQGNSDDYVDFYEGYYPASLSWTPGEETYQGAASEITLSRFN